MPSLREVIEARRAEIASKPPSPLREGETPDEAAERDAQRVSKAVSEMAARGVVEAFRATLEGREPDYEHLNDIESKPETARPTPQGLGPSLLRFEREVEVEGESATAVTDVTEVSLDARGIVEVHCRGRLGDRLVPFDLPIYIVNPSVLVPDDEGDIEQVVGEDDEGQPVIQRYREDPVAAMQEILLDLAIEDRPDLPTDEGG